MHLLCNVKKNINLKRENMIKENVYILHVSERIKNKQKICNIYTSIII